MTIKSIFTKLNKISAGDNRWKFVTLVVAVITLVGIRMRMGYSQNLKLSAFTSTATLALPGSLATNINANFSVPVSVDTMGTTITSVDVSLTFDPTKIELLNINPIAQNATALKLFLPMDSQGVFDDAKVVAQANVSGKIDFSAITYDRANQTLLTGYQGATQVAMLNFRAKSITGSTSITYNMAAGSTTDSNIVVNNGGIPTDVLNQSSQIINLANLTINSIVNPTITPVVYPTIKPTSTPVPTVNPTITPTAYPTIKPTFTPVPTFGTTVESRIVDSNDTYVLSGQTENLNEFQRALYVDGKPIKITYLRFNLSSLAGSKVNSAKLSFKTTSGEYSGSPNKVDISMIENNSWSETANYSLITSYPKTRLNSVYATRSNTIYYVNLPVSVIQSKLGGYITLVVSPTGEDALYFNSRESSDYKPQLIISSSK